MNGQRAKKLRRSATAMAYATPPRKFKVRRWSWWRRLLRLPKIETVEVRPSPRRADRFFKRAWGARHEEVKRMGQIRKFRREMERRQLERRITAVPRPKMRTPAPPTATVARSRPAKSPATWAAVLGALGVPFARRAPRAPRKLEV